MIQLQIPEMCLVVLIGPSGSGKSTFARTHFKPTEVLSSDVCRSLVSDDENDQAATGDAFDVLKFIAGKRLARGLLTVVDATNVQIEARGPWVALAREHDLLPVAIVLNLPAAVCQERNASRADRQFGPHVIRNQSSQLRRSLRGLQREGFRHVFVLDSLEEIASVSIERQRLWNDRSDDHGPFDIIGDVHGCIDELRLLLAQLGYRIDADQIVTPPPGRRAVFVGDLVDRGPDSLGVLRTVMQMCRDGHAMCVPGNHDEKLLRKILGKNVTMAHGLEETFAQIDAHRLASNGAIFDEIRKFIDSLVSHLVFDDGKLVVAHGGMKQQYIGRASRRVREFALYGDTTGELDELGLPVRNNWAADYRGRAAVVYGHTPVPRADWLNGTLNIDTGCCFGGSLSALRWPEREVVSVKALRTYAEPARPFLTSELSPQQEMDDVLDYADVSGKRLVTTRLQHNVTVRAENATAALEVMSRFAASPKWLIYLPPTMSPSETTSEPGLLEHPREAFEYFRKAGVGRVICEEKHMGSRAVVIVCRDERIARERFGIEGESGIIYTRTGRRFFDDMAVEGELLRYVRDAATAAGLWQELESDWLCLDCELMPWSAKAQELLTHQYAAVGVAAEVSLSASVSALEQANNAALAGLLQQQRERLARAEDFVAAYRRYCWPVASVADLKLAPFHLLASEGRVHVDRDHAWHMTTLARLATPGSPIIATPFEVIDLSDAASVEAGIAWWEKLTAAGGEGMVVKPLDFIAQNPRGLVQPAVKCRGKEYLRIIYGPEYDAPANLSRLRARGLNFKRSLALREFALGVESLERFVRREPLRRVHECVFGVLALESEPVDPRL